MLYAPHPPYVPAHVPQHVPQAVPPHVPQHEPQHVAQSASQDIAAQPAAPQDSAARQAVPPAPATGPLHDPSAADHCDAIHTALLTLGAQTIHELAQATGLSHVQVARRLPEMRGRAVVTARTRPGPAGRLCRVWRAARVKVAKQVA